MIKVLNKDFCLREENSLCVGTHNGVFHCDDIISVSLLNILNEGIKDVEVIRTRDLNFLRLTTDIMVDVGGGKYDHHQIGGNGQRENGVQYASAGLIWRDFGKLLIEKLANGKLNQQSIEKLFNIIDNDIIQNIDKEDNGQSHAIHPFQFIQQFLPDWYDSMSTVDEEFERCANISLEILKRIIKGYISLELARNEIESRMKSSDFHMGDVLLIPSQTIPWMESVVNYNNNEENIPINFVVFAHPDGGYALQCVPLSVEDSFSKRVPLPNSWAGETINLPNISGFKSATFCHRGRFFARANEFDDIISMCNKATKDYFDELGKIPTRKRIKPE